jgi:hypothetical protein
MRYLSSLLLLLPVPLLAQHDMIGVTFTGQSVAFDSRTGAGVLLTTNPLGGQNAMARLGNTLFSTDRVTPPGGTGFTFSFGRVSALTGQYVRNVANIGDLRGLAAHATDPQLLYGILDGSPDLLVTIDTTTGTRTTIGSTGRTGIQALTLFRGRLLAWDVSAGLMQLNPGTGLATDISAQIGGSGSVQWLCAHADGRLLGGNQALFEIDPATGNPTFVASVAGGTFDIRGAEQRMPLQQSFGQGCNTALNVPSVLSVSGGNAPGPILFQSLQHQPGAFGALILGFVHHSTPQQQLPLSLDALLGTSGCTVYQTLDIVVYGFLDTQGRFGRTVTLPPFMAGQTFYSQYVVFETVPGGFSWSNSVMVTVGI